MRKLLTVTVGIPTFQAERNIRNLLTSISQQQTALCKIEKILVYSDGSTDRTIKMARAVKDPRITVFESKQNRGYAAALGFLIKKSESDVFVTLNDDILISDSTTIGKLIAPFYDDSSITFVSGNIVALRPRTFIGRCIFTSFLAFLPIRYSLREGNNMYSCDGKILALRHNIARRISLDHASTATVDIFLYFENLRLNGVYRFARDATVQFRLPETIWDWKNLQYRTILAHRLMKEKYGILYESEAKIPFFLYCTSVARAVCQYPFESLIFKFFVNTGLSPKYDQPFKRWSLTESTKHLNNGLLIANGVFDQFQQIVEGFVYNTV